MPVIDWLERADSTNAVLAARERDALQPHLAVVATLDQRVGRGRLDRTWSAPAGASLALSILVRVDRLPPERLGALPLVGGLAAREAAASLLPGRAVGVKWPNDVLVDGRKLAGVLAEAVPTGAVVLGVGMNTAMRAEELPVPTATSIAIAGGAPVDAEAVRRLAAAIVAGVGRRVERLAAAGGDLAASGLLAELEEACETIGREVRVELPGGRRLLATAVGVDGDGALVVAESGRTTAILAGDVTHLRYQ